MHKHQRQKIVIVGGGFGGIKAALMLDNSDLFDVILVSDKPTFRYYPRLYHTATGGDPSETSIKLSHIFRKSNVKIIIGNVQKVERKDQFIETDKKIRICYDTLILALGVQTNYFGLKGLDKYAYGIKSMEEAERLKKHLHKTLIVEQSTDRHYIVIGAGPTGIELAGQLSFYLRDIVKKHKLKNQKIKIDLIEAAPRLLPSMPIETSEAVAQRLKHIGVNLMVNNAVQSQSIDDLIVNDKPIESHTVIWTAGVTNNSFFKNNSFNLNEHGKVIIDEYFMAEKDIYVIGDNAATEYSGMAQTALNNAVDLSRNIIRQANNKTLTIFKPVRPIYVIPTGNKWAAVVWGNIKIHGILGWVLREFADLIAFHDLEPWWNAGSQWMNEFDHENKCPICDHLID